MSGTLLTSADRARHFDKLVKQRSGDSRAYLERISGRFVGIQVRRSIELGDAAESDCQKGRSQQKQPYSDDDSWSVGLNRWLLGSVAEKVLRATTNPLLLVRATMRANPTKWQA